MARALKRSPPFDVSISVNDVQFRFFLIYVPIVRKIAAVA